MTVVMSDPTLINVNGVIIKIETVTIVTAVPVEPPINPPVEPPINPPPSTLADAGAPWPIGSFDAGALQPAEGMRPDPVSPVMRTIYLDPMDGRDNDDGLSWTTAKRTWQGAQAAVVDGDKAGRTIVVRDGTDPGPVIWTKSGGPGDERIVIRPETLLGVTITGDNRAYSIVRFEDCSNVWFHGFRVDGGKARGGHGIDVQKAHLINITKNEVFNAKFGGISSAWSDLVNIAGNVVRDCDLEDYGSGISVYQPVQRGPLSPGYRILIHNNTVYGVRWKSGRRTDANGIIIDDPAATQDILNRPDGPYLSPILVAGNLVVDNDGIGIAVLWGGNCPVDVVHNTSYRNSRDNRADQSWVGEGMIRAAPGVRWWGNVSVADSNSGDPDAAGLNICRIPSEPAHDSVVVDYSLYIDKGNERRHLRLVNSPPLSGGKNWIGARPRFVNASIDSKTWDYSLDDSSPAKRAVPPLPPRSAK